MGKNTMATFSWKMIESGILHVESLEWDITRFPGRRGKEGWSGDLNGYSVEIQEWAVTAFWGWVAPPKWLFTWTGDWALAVSKASANTYSSSWKRRPLNSSLNALGQMLFVNCHSHFRSLQDTVHVKWHRPWRALRLNWVMFLHHKSSSGMWYRVTYLNFSNPFMSYFFHKLSKDIYLSNAWINMSTQLVNSLIPPGIQVHICVMVPK